jgi:hypothetical protein
MLSRLRAGSADDQRRKIMSQRQMFIPALAGRALAVLALACLTATPLSAQEKSADEIAKEMSNPTAAVGSMNNNFDFKTFDGDLPESGDQTGFSYLFQPGLPFPQDNGFNLLIRPAVSILFKQPVFDPASGEFEDEGTELGDTGFDVAYGTTYDNGVLFLFGAVGTLPTNTDDKVGVDQYRLGPEVLVGVLKKWGLVGILINQQWDVAGDDETDTSVTGGQYFYAFSLKKGWQIFSGPTWSYNREAPSGDRWTIPVGIGVSKTIILDSGMPMKFQAQYWKYVASPDSFGPDDQLRFTISPVIELPWSKS